MWRMTLSLMSTAAVSAELSRPTRARVTAASAAAAAADCLRIQPARGAIGDGIAGTSSSSSDHDGAQPWLVNTGLGRVFSGGKWGAATRGPAGEPRRASGTDANGDFQSVSCDWPATAEGGPALRTTATRYAAAGAVVYELAFPQGASRTNVSVPGR